LELTDDRNVPYREEARLMPDPAKIVEL